MLTGQHCSGHLLVFGALGFSPCVCYKWAFSQFNCHSPAKMTFLEHKSDHVASQFKTYQWPRNKAHFLTQQSRLPRCVVQFISSCPRFTSMKSALVPPIGNNCSHLTSDQSLLLHVLLFSRGFYLFANPQNQSSPSAKSYQAAFVPHILHQGCCHLPWLPTLRDHRFYFTEKPEVSTQGPSSLWIQPFSHHFPQASSLLSELLSSPNHPMFPYP